MKVKIFTNRAFLGAFEPEYFFKDHEIIAVGTILVVEGKKCCVNNVSVNNEGTIILEVN